MPNASHADEGGRHVLVWDLETVPDLDAVARMHGRVMTPAEAEAALGDKFPPLPLHKIVCIGALIAQHHAEGWRVRSLGAPHSGLRPEHELLTSFIERLTALRPQLVSFNGHGFDLPVLRYRAMIHKVSAPTLESRGIFRRYGEEALDLCDVLSSFDGRGKVGLDALCRILALPGKPGGVDGSAVAQYVKDGRIQDVADYCESDVVNTYRVWLRHELFKGRLTQLHFDASEANLVAFIGEAQKPHLSSHLPTDTTAST
jgi:predicted PolB exonuclease-like 3'-5' exonuclease